MKKKIFFNFFGGIFLLIGLIGVFVPLLPTTPFLLLATICFSRGSEAFNLWILNHKLLGPPLKEWQENKSISLKARVLATLMLFVSSAFVLPKPQIPIVGKAAYGVLVAGVLIFLWTRAYPAKKDEKQGR